MSSKKIQIVLDLDETLLNSVPYSEFQKLPLETQKLLKKKYVHHKMGKDYIVFERPGLQEFLNKIFRKYKVSIWTAATKSYLVFILDKIILKDISPSSKKGMAKKRGYEYVFWSDHCDLAREDYGKTKNLNYLKDISGIESTYILDDNYKVYKSQPKSTIRIYPFYALENVNEEKLDHELDKIDLEEEIKKLKK